MKTLSISLTDKQYSQLTRIAKEDHSSIWKLSEKERKELGHEFVCKFHTNCNSEKPNFISLLSDSIQDLAFDSSPLEGN